jgi:hypothetical protein
LEYYFGIFERRDNGLVLLVDLSRHNVLELIESSDQPFAGHLSEEKALNRNKFVFWLMP